ncbi:hypothetical protein ACOMHN_058879 [Nucella lapillus]
MSHGGYSGPWRHSYSYTPSSKCRMVGTVARGKKTMASRSSKTSSMVGSKQALHSLKKPLKELTTATATTTTILSFFPRGGKGGDPHR